MDMLAHALWAGVGVAVLRRRMPVPRKVAAATVALAVLPDVAQFLPLLAWYIGGDGSWAALQAFAVASPGQEPLMPAWVSGLSHHLHCIMHSAVIASLVTLMLSWAMRRFWIPLAGWWSHILIDVPTHSADFYPVPVLYPFTYAGFDGWAWNQPWMLALTYGALAISVAALFLTRRR